MPLTPQMVARPAQLAERNGYARRASTRETSYSNEEITPEIALTVPAVLAAFTILSEDIASLPLIYYERGPGGQVERAYTDPYYRLMHDSPNPEHTSLIFREILMGHLLAWGNFYSQIIVDDAGQVAELWPLRPDRMTVARVDGQRVYTYTQSDGRPRVFLSDEVLHIPAFGFDGLVGYSRIALARNAIGLAISTEKFGSKFFANDARPGIVLKTPNPLSDQAYARLESSWDAEHKGAENAHKTAILEEGLDVVEIGIPPEDAQFIQTQQWTLGQVARVFRVPPHMIGDVDRSTSWGSGIDSQEQGYISHTLRPWTIRTEQVLNQRLLLPAERATHYWEHLFDGLLRGDITTRFGAYVQAINNGIMSPNEVRAKENLNAYEGGDVHLVPLNTTPVSTAGQQPAAPARPSAPGGPAGPGGPGPMKPPTPYTPAKPGSSIAAGPILLDAAVRILKRESAELRDATTRWVARGQVQKFETWLTKFYNQELPEYAAQVLGPLVQAGLVAAGSAQAWVADYCQEQGTQVLLGAQPAEPEQAASEFIKNLLGTEPVAQL